MDSFDEHDLSYDNDSRPILVPIRESLIGPDAFGKKEWHWYRWTRSKYQLHHKHHGVKKSINGTDIVIVDLSDNATDCIEIETLDTSLDDFPDDLFTSKFKFNINLS